MNSLRRGLLWSALANLTITGSAALLTFVLPFYLDPFEYGVWQYYALLVLWLGYGTLGIADGWFSRFAGQRFEDLPGYSLRWHTLYVGGLAFSLVLASITLGLFAPGLASSFRYEMLVLALAGSAFFLPRSVVFFALQGSRRYGTTFAVVLAERFALVLGGILIAFGVGAGGKDLALLDIGGKVLGLILILALSHRLLRQKAPLPLGSDQEPDTRPRLRPHAEVALSWRIGLPIALAAIASIAVYGIPRLIVEFALGLDIFANVSLAVSLSLFLVGLFGSLGIVIFPEFRSVSTPQVQAFSQRLERVLLLLIGPALLLAFPMAWAIRSFLSEYSLAADCLWPLYAALFAEARVRFISTNLLRLRGRQTYVLLANVVAVVIASVGTWIASVYLEDAVWAMYCILAAVLARSVMLDAQVSRELQTSFTLGKAAINAVPLIFVLSSLLPAVIGVPVYLLGLTLAISTSQTSSGTRCSIVRRRRTSTH